MVSHPFHVVNIVINHTKCDHLFFPQAVCPHHTEGFLLIVTVKARWLIDMVSGVFGKFGDPYSTKAS